MYTKSKNIYFCTEENDLSSFQSWHFQNILVLKYQISWLKKFLLNETNSYFALLQFPINVIQLIEALIAFTYICLFGFHLVKVLSPKAIHEIKSSTSFAINGRENKFTPAKVRCAWQNQTRWSKFHAGKYWINTKCILLSKFQGKNS